MRKIVEILEDIRHRLKRFMYGFITILKEPKCKYWLVCGAAMIRDYHAKQVFGHGDARRNYIDIVCRIEKEVLKCEHYKIREDYQK